MKKLISIFMFIICAIFFTGCNDDFETPGKSVPSANAGSVQVKLETTASPVLKDGDDENNPDPMFDVTGVVTLNGTPVSSEVELVAIPGNSLVDSTITDSNGGFGFYQVPSGSYNVIVYVDGNVSDIVAVNL